jgi:hypothetical protein
VLCGRFSLRVFVRFIMALHVFWHPSCQLALHCAWVPLLPTCLSLPVIFVHFVMALRAFGHPSCQLTLPCPWSPNLGHVVLKNLPPSQNWFLFILQLIFFPSAPLCGCFHYGSLCVLGAHIFYSPCVAFGHPSCQLALPFPWFPNLGHAVLKNLPPSQNWFLSVL